MNETVDVGLAIRAARRKNGLSQAQLAELAEISERTLRDIEKGRPGVGFAAVIAVARALGLRIEAR